VEYREQESQSARGDGTGIGGNTRYTEMLHLEAAGETSMQVTNRNVPLVPRARVLRKCSLSRSGCGDDVRVPDFKSYPCQQVDTDKHKNAYMGESDLHWGLMVNIAFLRCPGKRLIGP
jgi:hypothetical protein